ncbi:MAG TPA: YraN family protein [Clostridiaceae bacterium]|jgi:putative endonuclease|nr:YraN family protein [Clostridiaceae bacterium]
MNSIEIGIHSEQAVSDYLSRQGYVLLARNLRFHNAGELDLVFLFMRRIVIVEVKSRRASCRYGDAIEAVDSAKKMRIYSAAKRLAHRNGLESCEFCFIVACVTHDRIGNAQKIKISTF